MADELVATKQKKIQSQNLLYLPLRIDRTQQNVVILLLMISDLYI